MLVFFSLLELPPKLVWNTEKITLLHNINSEHLVYCQYIYIFLLFFLFFSSSEMWKRFSKGFKIPLKRESFPLGFLPSRLPAETSTSSRHIFTLTEHLDKKILEFIFALKWSHAEESGNTDLPGSGESLSHTPRDIYIFPMCWESLRNLLFLILFF